MHPEALVVSRIDYQTAGNSEGKVSAALDVINHGPQIKSLCWFIDDFPHDAQWDLFSLTKHPGRLIDAAEEFDRLLQTTR